MPPAAKNLFKKRFLDFQKLFIIGNKRSNYRNMPGPGKIEVFDPLFSKKWAAGGIDSSKKLKIWMGRSKGHKSSFIPAHPRISLKDTGRSSSLGCVRFNSS